MGADAGAADAGADAGAAAAEDSSEGSEEEEDSEEAEEEEDDGVDGVSLGDGKRWLVERLLGRRTSLGCKAGDSYRAGTTLYKVHWKNCPEEEASWEPKSRIAAQLVSDFEAANPSPAPQPASPSSSKRPHQPVTSPSAKSPEAKRHPSGTFSQAGDQGFIAELD